MAYEFKSNDVFGFGNNLGYETRQKGNELFFKYCPYCSGNGKDKDTMSVNLDTGQFKCFRASCGKQGHFVELARDFNYPLDFGDYKPRQYRKLTQPKIEVRAKAIEYMGTRGIGKEVVERYQLTTQTRNDNILVFPFYDHENILQFVKYRKIDFNPEYDRNKEWAEKDTMPILFGMKQCVDFETLVITEGQIDSLTLAECGIKNAVSVPTGAMGFTWLENCWDWIVQFKEVVIFGDYENGKITLVDELSKRLPMPVKVVQEIDYLGEKDANLILTKYGKPAIIKAVENAKIKPLNHVKELADVETVDLNSLDGIYTGIKEIDRILGKLYYGQVVLLTGKRGEGKSTFMSQLIVESIHQNKKALAYSGELTDYHFKRWLDFQAAGSNNVVINKNSFGDNVYMLTDQVIEKLNNWYRGKAYIYDNNAIDDTDEYESLCETIEKAIQRYGINLVCVDNLMTAMDLNAKDDVYQAQSRFVKKLKQIAVKYNVVVILVAHPRKTNGNIADNDDVSGSSDITNRVDLTISYSRAEESDTFSSYLRVMKNRLTGRTTRKGEEIGLFYSEATKQITSILSEEKQYGWQNALTEEEKFSLQDLPF